MRTSAPSSSSNMTSSSPRSSANARNWRTCAIAPISRARRRGGCRASSPSSGQEWIGNAPRSAGCRPIETSCGPARSSAGGPPRGDEGAGPDPKVAVVPAGSDPHGPVSCREAPPALNPRRSVAGTKPSFSLLLLVDDPRPDDLAETLASVEAQSDPAWELVCVRRGSFGPPASEVLRSAAERDPRIVVIEAAAARQRAAALNAAIERARGEFIAIVEPGDRLTGNCLAVIARTVAANADADYLYSDEDRVVADGNASDVIAKPDWSPERLRGQMYTGGCPRCGPRWSAISVASEVASTARRSMTSRCG